MDYIDSTSTLSSSGYLSISSSTLSSEFSSQTTLTLSDSNSSRSFSASDWGSLDSFDDHHERKLGLCPVSCLIHGSFNVFTWQDFMQLLFTEF